MTRIWQPNGSNSGFWRSDNPLISAWYRFGNQLPKNQFLSNEEAGSPTVYLSGLLVDSGPQKHHLLPYFRSEAHEDYMTPVASIAPWDPDGSGLQFGGPEGSDNNVLIADPAWLVQNDLSIQDFGMMSPGVNLYSGMCVIGWVQIPETSTGLGNRTIIGRADQDSGTAFIGWRLGFQQQTATDHRFIFNWLVDQNFTFNGETTVATRFFQANSLESPDHPFFPMDRTQPFFVAVSVSREFEEDGRTLDKNGSGLVRLAIGNAESGITAFREAIYIGPGVDTTFSLPNYNGVPLSVGGDSRPLRSAANTNRRLPGGSIVDEFVIVQNGYLTLDQIEHYALSGMEQITTSDPEHPSFEPEFPGTDGLVAYWSFDEEDGSNSAPATTNDPRLDLAISGTNATYVDGIRQGGMAIRLDTSFNMTDATGGGTLLASAPSPLIPAESGLDLLFPDGDTVDEGMTILMWSRSEIVSNNQNGFTVGWYGNPSERNNAFWTDSANISNDGGLFMSISPSGISLPNSTIDTETNRFNAGQVSDTTWDAGQGLGDTADPALQSTIYNTATDHWHMWAFIYDVKAGQTYMVKDAKQLIPMTQSLSSESGFSREGYAAGDGVFGVVPKSTNPVVIDEWAVYNRILSIPEISGFAINSIGGAPVETDLDTSQKALVGYWPMDEFVNYDPAGISGFRLDDKSWYFHHLTNLSGAFSFSSDLNPERLSFSNSLQIDLSGSMVSLESTFHGQNLDASDSSLFEASGFAAGAWVYIPSGDLSTEGQGSSGLFGTHMLFGAFPAPAEDSSWFVGIDGNRLSARFTESNQTENVFISDVEPTYNEAFFVGVNFFPSGASNRVQLVKIGGAFTDETQYAIDQGFTTAGITPQSVGASGFSVLNAPDRDWGFPQQTRIQDVFMHLGYLNEDRWQRVKRDGVNVQTLASGSVSSFDPSNVSHWTFDRGGSDRFEDFGQAQNFLFLNNTDSHETGTFESIHTSGVVIRRSEYLDTLAGNLLASGIDLGADGESWTFMTWVLPTAATLSDQHVILNKGSGPASAPSGVQIFTPADSLSLSAIATGDITVAGQNGTLAPAQWNHIAVTYDRGNDEFATIINGRYAGTAFTTLADIPINNSGLTLGGRGDQNSNPIFGGSAFSGLLDDALIFKRVLTLPEISGIAANSYVFNDSSTEVEAGPVGGYISGLLVDIVSGLVGSFIHGQGQDFELTGGYVSGVSGAMGTLGGYIQGVGIVSGIEGIFIHGQDSVSGLFGHFIHGQDSVSGLFGTYLVGGCQALSEFDISLTFQVLASEDFDARLGVEATNFIDFDSRLGVVRVTQPPQCSLEMPLLETVVSGIPYTLTVQGSGIAQDDKEVSKVRFTFADFKGAESGTLVDGVTESGLYQASRVYDTPGWYTVKIEVTDSFGYKASCARPFLLLPSGSTSGQYVNTLPGFQLDATPVEGITIQRVQFTHSLSGIDSTSGVFEYTDFADGQESLVNSLLEFPSGTPYTSGTREHDYTMPGTYAAVWAASGSWGIVSDSISTGLDYLT